MDQKQLREQENRCIQEQAPACTAACPVHVDVRALTAEIARGDFTAASKLFRKTVPFPGIISHICPQPCQTACLRKDLGGAIEIAALERACLDLADADETGIKTLPRKSKTVAVVGGGVSGLTVAYDLARKGWGVVLFEASDRIGGGLWKIPPDRLPRQVLAKDLSVFDQLEVKIHLNVEVGHKGGNGHSTFIDRLCEEFDALFLGVGARTTATGGFQLDDKGKLAIDPLTFQTSIACVFAGGDVLRASVNFPNREPQHSAILSISDGRRAAISIDRYLQKVSLSASRSNEGPYETRLYTDITAIEPQKALLETDLSTRYNAEVAETEAARCIQCECMECVKACEYLKQYQGYPKKYIREVYNNLSIVMGTRFANQFINSCALCGLCGEVCPTDVDMGLICKNARQQMVDQKRMPASAFDFALQDMAFSNGEKFALARTDPQKGVNAYAFFPGCQLSASAPEHTRAVYAFLRDTFAADGVGLMLRCCGAPADWAGRTDLFAAAQEEFRSDYEALGRPKLILACSSCYQMFKNHFPDVEILSLWDVYAQTESHNEATLSPSQTLALHDPCSTRYETHIQNSVRSILTGLGCTLEELPYNREKTECCSYGGLVWNANRSLSKKFIQRRIAESPNAYVTYCIMCRDFFASQGKPSLHILDLIFSPDQPERALRASPNYSQRHENRARLKESFLKELWSETMPDQQPFEAIQLILPDDLQPVLEERLILVEDMQKVIEFAQRTGKRMLNRATGHYLAYFKPTSVTYWVEYTPQPDGSFLVHKAYSHRMEIGLGDSK